MIVQAKVPRPSRWRLRSRYLPAPVAIVVDRQRTTVLPNRGWKLLTAEVSAALHCGDRDYGGSAPSFPAINLQVSRATNAR